MFSCKPKLIPYGTNLVYNGVFRYIQNITKEFDIHSKGFVEVKSDLSCGIVRESGKMQVPFIYKNDDDIYWRTNDCPNQWIEVNLKRFYLRLTSYDFKTHKGDFFSKWILYGSNNGINFTKIHTVTNFKQPASDFYTAHFDLSCANRYKYFHFEPIGLNGFNKNYFAIHRIEFYGVLYTPIGKTSQKQWLSHMQLFKFFMLFFCGVK